MPSARSRSSERKGKVDTSEAKHPKQVREEDVVDCKDLGLKLYTTKEMGWPVGNYTVKDLVSDLRSDIYKFTLEEERLNEDDIYKMILAYTIILKGCWNTVNNDETEK